MLARVFKSEKLDELRQALKEGQSLLIENLWNTPKAILASLAAIESGKHVLILTGSGQEEARLYHDFAYFTKTPILDFPAWETLPGEAISPSPDIVGERYSALRELSLSKEPHIVISNLQAVLQKLILPKKFQDLYLHLIKGKSYPFNTLIEKLEKMGYERSGVVSDKGQFAVRGGIIDIFPVSLPDPHRLEFWEDELESIRLFDPIGQLSVKHVEEVSITPAKELELLLHSKTLGTVLNYLGKNTLVIFDDLLALEDRYSALVADASLKSQSFASIEEFLDEVTSLQKIFLSQQPIEELSEIQIEKDKKSKFYSISAPMQSIEFQMFNRHLTAKRWVAPFSTIGKYFYPDIEDSSELSGQEIFEGIATLQGKEGSLYIICLSELEEMTFRKRLKDGGIFLPHNVVFEIGYLSKGMVFKETGCVLLPVSEITGRMKIRRQKQRSTYHTLPSETLDIAKGDIVVHYIHGIGRYLGIEKRLNNDGVSHEFLLIEYADNGKLFVPLNQAHLITKYIGASEEIPSMHNLGENRWKKKREQAERAVLEYAAELLDLYAKRELSGGFICQPDGQEMEAFEEDFPYVETEDQLSAIQSIKEDMISPKSMDRLICGDVGYGKTEVAMRAAFKAVSDGEKQVAVLVPTTVLAMQHFESFVERFSNFPVTIGVLSRFRTAKQIKETLEGMKTGAIDIVIGTHRIISQDVEFKDLGLIIIDEEQRFGVKAKEHLKRMKVGVDCLTLSATPIPRTLYMSLIGARDMSVINTPPQDRLPITTLLVEPNDQLIKNAMLRELSREGQIFIIHNRVETIFDYALHIQKLLPKAKIVVAHGQMHSDEIDLVFHKFKSGEADILVATSIIENGIDIPNGNTIIIDRADRFGMADLYQLRGRVGRWNRRAYAYLLVPKLHALPEIVKKRLEALVSSSGYGGGMRVAMRDLEIRGAGNILGMEQSGQVSSIGFNLYCKLLKRTLLKMQGKAPPVITDTKIEFLVDARISEDYVSEPNFRMEIYMRFGEAISLEEVDNEWKTIQDRFGKPPESAIWLYHLTRIRVFAALRSITLVKQEKFSLILEKQKGKETKRKSLLIQWPKKPKEVEEKVFALINS